MVLRVVVAASREFVCIRPQTYESASEAEVLKWVYSDRDGTLRNTSFGILSSDGTRKLSATGRSPGTSGPVTATTTPGPR